jgi:hypothetical protein
VQSGADLDTERPDSVANCHGAADRSLRPVERGEETIAGRADLATAKTY